MSSQAYSFTRTKRKNRPPRREVQDRWVVKPDDPRVAMAKQRIVGAIGKRFKGSVYMPANAGGMDAAVRTIMPRIHRFQDLGAHDYQQRAVVKEAIHQLMNEGALVYDAQDEVLVARNCYRRNSARRAPVRQRFQLAHA